MFQVQLGALVFRADDFHVADQFFWMWIVQQKREVFRRFVSQPAAAGFLPAQAFVEYIYAVAGTREFFPAHGARWSATDDDNLSHLCVLSELCSPLRRRRDRADHWAAGSS